MTKVNIETSILHDTKHIIEISVNKNINIRTYAYRIIKLLMNYMNYQLGANTAVNYHMMPLVQLKISIPVNIYTKKEINKNINIIVKERIDMIQNLFETINWNKQNKIYLWCLRSLKILNIDLSKLFIVSSDNIDYNDYLHFTIPELKLPEMKKTKLKDGSTIYQYIDKYIDNYGVFCNLSKKYSEMNYSYNILHLYEHIMTYAWKELSSADLVDLNGSTYPNGICNIYAINKTKSACEEYLYNYINFYLNGRNSNFWNNMREGIEVETMRTISETYLDTSLTSIGRSDAQAFDMNYDTNIFSYWCQMPFNVLITTPEEIILESNKIHNIKYQSIPRPKIDIFKIIPLEVLRRHNEDKLYILKESSKTIIQKLLNNSDLNVLYGLDCKLIVENENLSEMITPLYLLLYFRDDIEPENIKKYITNNIFPQSSELFNLASIAKENYKSYFTNLKDPLI